MKTFILFWNPAISNDKGEGRTEFINSLQEGCFYTADWAVWDWQEAHKGDRFYKVMVGNPESKKNGIVESGFFTSDPYVGEDWSGRGRKVHYCDLQYDAVLDFNFLAPLSIEELKEKLPSFDWTGGHSGRLIDEDMAKVLDVLWCEHLIDPYDIRITEGDEFCDDEKDDVDWDKLEAAECAANEEAKSHLYVCYRLRDRLIRWYDPEEWCDDEEEYGPEVDIDYTQRYNIFHITGIKDIDYNAILADAAKALSPQGQDYAIIEMVHDNEDKKILEEETIYIKGLSAQGIQLTKYKSGAADLELSWMASMGDIDLTYQILLAIRKHSSKSKIKIVYDDGTYEVLVDDDLLYNLKSQRLNSMMGMLVYNRRGLFGINGIRHMFYVSPEELNRFMPGTSLLERAKFIMNEFCTIQWAYEDYHAVGLCEITIPSGEEYQARILTNSDRVFVGYAERFWLMLNKEQVKIVSCDDFVSAVSHCEYFHAVDPIQFTLEKMPPKIWTTLLEKIDGEIISNPSKTPKN